MKNLRLATPPLLPDTPHRNGISAFLAELQSLESELGRSGSARTATLCRLRTQLERLPSRLIELGLVEMASSQGSRIGMGETTGTSYQLRRKSPTDTTHQSVGPAAKMDHNAIIAFFRFINSYKMPSFRLRGAGLLGHRESLDTPPPAHLAADYDVRLGVDPFGRWGAG